VQARIITRLLSRPVTASISESEMGPPQVAALKRQHPGIMLLIEVGYKMRLFGDDAEDAANVLHIFAYQDRNYLTAGAIAGDRESVPLAAFIHQI
jgi:DNA mismatch repair protein MSH3